MRQEKSKPLVLALKAWFESQLTRVSAKATIAEDIRYALNHWDGLSRLSRGNWPPPDRIENEWYALAIRGTAHQVPCTRDQFAPSSRARIR